MKTQPLSSGSTATNANPLVNLAVNLSAAAYAGSPEQVTTAAEELGVSVVWGPAESTHNGVSDSLMFVAYNPTMATYWVTIRGTEVDSLYSWLNEDFDIRTTVPFTNYVSSAPADAMLSQATANGLDLILGLSDPNSGLTLLQFLASLGTSVTTFITGHSLGGTLVPPLYAIIYDQIYGGSNTKLGYFSFAGLTSGNIIFAQYFDQIDLANGQTDMRVVNPLDVAPDCFGDGILFTKIYDAFALPWSSVPETFRIFIDGLFLSGAANFYAQPSNPSILPTDFNHGLDDWMDQAAYQHHISTYQALVAQAYSA